MTDNAGCKFVRLADVLSGLFGKADRFNTSFVFAYFAVKSACGYPKNRCRAFSIPARLSEYSRDVLPFQF